MAARESEMAEAARAAVVELTVLAVAAGKAAEVAWTVPEELSAHELAASFMRQRGAGPAVVPRDDALISLPAAGGELQSGQAGGQTRNTLDRLHPGRVHDSESSQGYSSHGVSNHPPQKARRPARVAKRKASKARAAAHGDHVVLAPAAETATRTARQLERDAGRVMSAAMREVAACHRDLEETKRKLAAERVARQSADVRARRVERKGGSGHSVTAAAEAENARMRKDLAKERRARQAAEARARVLARRVDAASGHESAPRAAWPQFAPEPAVSPRLCEDAPAPPLVRGTVKDRLHGDCQRENAFIHSAAHPAAPTADKKWGAKKALNKGQSRHDKKWAWVRPAVDIDTGHSGAL